MKDQSPSAWSGALPRRQQAAVGTLPAATALPAAPAAAPPAGQAQDLRQEVVVVHPSPSDGQAWQQGVRGGAQQEPEWEQEEKKGKREKTTNERSKERSQLHTRPSATSCCMCSDIPPATTIYAPEWLATSRRALPLAQRHRPSPAGALDPRCRRQLRRRRRQGLGILPPSAPQPPPAAVIWYALDTNSKTR